AVGSSGLGYKFKNAEAWARAEASGDPVALEETIKQLNADIATIEKLNRSAERVLASKSELKGARQAHQQAEQTLKEVEKKADKGSAGLATLLKDAWNYLSKSPDEICPVCEETRIEAPQLVQRLGDRLNEMAPLNSSSRSVQDASDNLQAKQTLYQQATDDLIRAAGSALDRYGEELSQAGEFNKAKETEPEKA
ncbi:MAG: hypothetical protein GY815_19290, partial [Gammaproteobacteria bacterium]|nr:hypothetical protein [Gammaproteobacteria bacterium]